ncbi:flagellar hook capping FlgD N-terminal domain-containing protein [Sinisalibacter lacisalsi]|uniref:Basal-body rod modification protein FlgD n=1 Tax=Sinisalibacter lacisalsi TaxID=1526570 RepID=A0ABQ1QE65_9RHOB|nr:flagellar hook capping FlgD N-terminal domain-containing protein [Sinisalibacter lacisalsi]GGD22957.1 basal-body rod modification protein FlgD [Sinisalibacter lacisalsi]
METNTVSPALAGKGASAQPDAKETSAGRVISSDFETFLKMLTTQMENQDPLNPMESTDFAVQLATFSGVEQQVRTNDLLAAMSGQLGAMNMSDLAGWVGMEARATTSAWFDKTPITLYPDPASGAERTFVVVTDGQGTMMDRVEIPVSDQPVQWAGVSALGAKLPAGQYNFHLQSLSNGKIIGDAQIPVFSEITEARVEGGQTILVLASGAEIAASEVDALRKPPEAP